MWSYKSFRMVFSCSYGEVNQKIVLAFSITGCSFKVHYLKLKRHKGKV